MPIVSENKTASAAQTLPRHAAATIPPGCTAGHVLMQHGVVQCTLQNTLLTLPRLWKLALHA